MPYELRVPGEPPRSFDTEPAAVDAAKAVLTSNPDAEPEVIDLATGQPCAPGASKTWREEMKQRVGF